MDVEGCKKRLYQTIDRDKEELFVLLGSLIQINSENFGTHGNEANCSDFIRRYCEELGYEAESYSPMDIPDFQIHPDYLAGRGLEGRRNCTVIVPGEKHDRKLMLAAHIDTVEIGDESKWAFPPLCGEVRDGNILGRGACDDKYAVATALFLIKKLKELEIKLPYDLLFSGYCDEEQGGSNGALATCLRYPCDDFLNMDCKNFEIWNCASGGQDFEIVIKHTTHLDSCKKVFEGLEIAKKIIEEFGERRKAELKINPFYDGTIIPNTSLRFLKMGCGLNSNDMHVGSVKFVYYTDKDQEQINKEYNEMFDRINKEIAHLDLEIDKVNYISRFFRYGSTPADNENIVLLKEAGKKASGREIKACGSCLSDLSLFLANGKGVSYSFGIGRDFDAYGVAHQPDEYIECDKLLKYTKIIAQFVIDWHKKNS